MAEVENIHGKDAQPIFNSHGQVIAHYFASERIVCDKMGRILPAKSYDHAKQTCFTVWSYAR